MKHISTFESFLNEANAPKTNDKKAENLVKKIVKSNPRFKWLYDDLSNNYSLEDVEKILNDAGYGNEYDKHVKESENLNEMQKPKSWDTMFAMNAIKDYEEGKFDPDNKASLAQWEKDYNGGVVPRPGFETYDIIAYAVMTGKKPDGTPMVEK
jgi:hypothetical protein